MRLFKKLRPKLDYLQDNQIEQIYQAYLLACEAHDGQKRSTGEPYITHPVAVASILAEMHMDYETIIGALLHDVIEDTKIAKSHLVDKFGEEVTELVEGVSKLTKIEFNSRAEAQAENFRKMVLAMSRDIRVILIKLADRLHNMRTLDPLTPEKRRRIAIETLDIYAPIASRLGMHNFYLEFEELGFAARYPKRYQVIKETVYKARGNRKEIMGDIEKALKLGLKKGEFYFRLFGREKHLYGIYKKMSEKQLTFSEIMDVYAFRVLVKEKDNCYRALGLIHDVYKPVPERFKDYIAMPKTNNYRSLHTTLFGPYGVPIEIQIRTEEMEHTANNGIASHWLYKSKGEAFDASQIQSQQWLNSLLEMQQRTGNSLEFIENVKIDLFPDEVYIFTPKGKIMELPGGATAIDFAYAVHTDVGNTCVAAKVNRQLVPLSTVLSNGQTVEVITSADARPNPAWLNFVVTGKARSNIRHFLKSQRRSESVALGKRMLERALSTLSIALKKISKENINAVLSETKFETLDDLLEDIGLGNRIAFLVARRLLSLTEEQSETTAQLSTQEAKPLIIHGTEGMVVTFASCCHPIPYDPIVAFLNMGEGLVVHFEQCKNILKLGKAREEAITVRWADDVKGEFVVDVVVEVINKRGALAALALSISEANANIEGISIDKGEEHVCSVTLRLLVQNRVHLAQVIRNIRKVKVVLHITRTR